MKTKEELLKIALSGSIIKPYKEVSGFDEASKFLEAYNIKVKAGPHIPVKVVYYFYYNWVKDANKNLQPVRFSVFCRQMSRYVKSIPYSDVDTHRHFRAYKMTNFPKFTVEDELQARKMIRVQKSKIKGNKNRRRNKKVLQPKG